MKEEKEMDNEEEDMRRTRTRKEEEEWRERYTEEGDVGEETKDQATGEEAETSKR